MSTRFARIRWCVLAMAGALALNAPADEQKKDPAATYTVRLERPSNVGDKADLNITATSKETTTLIYDDREPEIDTTNSQTVITGRGETLAVDGQGNETKVSIKVGKAQSTVEGKTTDILPKGTLLIVEWKDDKTTFTVSGTDVSNEAEESLALALSLHDPRTHSDDEVFANSFKPKVGSAWPLNAELAAQDLTALGLPCEKKSVSGKSTLVAVRESNGVPCLHLLLEMNADNLKPEMAEGASVTKGSMQMLLHTMVPIDESNQYGMASLATRLSVTARRAASNGSPAMTVRTVTERGRAVTVKPVK